MTNLEISYRELFNVAQDILILVRVSDGRILLVNSAAVAAYGYTEAELLTMTVQDLRSLDTQDLVSLQLQQAYAQGVSFETLHKRKDGSVFPVEVTSHGKEMDGVAVTFSAVRDITRRREAENAMLVSEQKYRAFIEQNSEGVVLVDETGRIIEWNHAQEQISGIPHSLAVGKLLWDVQSRMVPTARRTPELLQTMKQKITEVLKAGRSAAFDKLIEVTVERPDGSQVVIRQTIFPINTPHGYRLGSIAYDITERKIAERTLQEKARLEEQLSQIANTAPGGLFTFKVDPDGTISIPYASPVWEDIHGIHVSDPKERAAAITETIHPDDLAGFVKASQDAARDLTTWRREFRIRHPLKGEMWLEGLSTPLRQANGSIVFHGYSTDITERKRAEEDLRQTSFWLEKTQRISQVGGWCFDLSSGKGWCSAEAREIYGLESQEFSLDSIRTIPLPEYQDVLVKAVSALVRKNEKYDYEYRIRNRLDGTLRDIHSLAEFDPQSRLVFGAIQDITAQKQAAQALQKLNAETAHHLEQLKALRQIDQSILSNLSLDRTLDVLLEQIIGTLRVDAADILLYNTQAQILTLGGVNGLASPLWGEILTLGQSHAGRVALLREMDFIPDLHEIDDDLTHKIKAAGEDFVSYIAVPLVAKGKLEGVLQLFHRSRLEPDADWMGFLAALADQAAIAIHSARLFKDQQLTNARLTQAYEDTIDGWSHALDLRDRETEGHSQRVTELTLTLARRLSIPDEQLVHMRRGAKLHDIGKMGIPDRILHKPGPLSDDEWEVMRIHPSYAVDLLSQIKFLEPALTIPRFHHERWDGSGYPKGLKGETIPLAARIFAVVDVWDALTSDRPYRPAWPKEKALVYICENSGILFDPAVVDAFLEIASARRFACGDFAEGT